MKRIYYLLFVLVLVGGCTSTPATKKSSTPAARVDGDDSDSSDEDQSKTVHGPLVKNNPEALARFATGESYVQNEKPEMAATQFLAAVRADPGNETLAIELAREFLRDKEPAKAIDILTKPAARSDASSLVLSWMARAWLFSGKTNQAVVVCRRALQKNSETLEGYDFLIETLAKGGHGSEALRALQRLAKTSRTNADYLVTLADLYSLYGKYQPHGQDSVKTSVIDLLDRAAKLDPSSDDLRQRLADAYGRFGQLQKAAMHYSKILAGMERPSAIRDALREKLANIYLQSGDRTNAIKQLQAIVHESPAGFPEAWYLLGTLAFEDQNLPEAGRAFEEAIILAPNIEQAYYDLALVQIDLKHTDEALKTLDKASGLFPKSFVGEFFTGLANARLKKFADAERHFAAAELLVKTNDARRLSKDFYFQFAAACHGNNDLKKSVELFEKCLVIDPNYAEAMNYLGYMWADRGENLIRARELIEKAVKLESKNAAYLDSLGWVFYKLNQPEQALPWLLKAQELSPEPDPELYNHLGDVYLALHQIEKARQVWEKSLQLEANPEIKKKLNLLPGGNS